VTVSKLVSRSHASPLNAAKCRIAVRALRVGVNKLKALLNTAARTLHRTVVPRVTKAKIAMLSKTPSMISFESPNSDNLETRPPVEGAPPPD
jgi:hypothetical protein